MRNVVFGLAFLAFTVTSASAAPLNLTSIVGGWGNVVGGSISATGNVADQGTDRIRWGGVVDDFSTGSGYNFTPAGDIIGAVLGTPFSLGVFSHVNQAVVATTAPTSVDYDISFSTNGVPGGLADTFTFGHTETPNVVPCFVGSVSVCDDIVTVTAGTLNQLIVVGGDTYFFNLLGFSVDGGSTILSQYFSQETTTNSATLYGMVTAQAVPEPASMLLLGTGLAIVCARRLRKRAK